MLCGITITPPRKPLIGAVEGWALAGGFELLLACAFFLALPAVFLRDEHLVVDVIDKLIRPSVVRALDLAGAMLSLIVLSVMAWQMVPLAQAMHEFGDVTSDLSIPKLYYWIPVLLGVIASALATLVFIVRWFRR